MNKKTKYIIPAVIILLFAVSIYSLWSMRTKYGVTDSYQEVKEDAYALYENGDIESAITMMETYCSYVITDIEARTILGDWYYEIGDEDAAYENYYMAAGNKTAEDAQLDALSVKNTQEILLQPVKQVRFEITPDVRKTKDMKLVITGRNIVPQVRHEGKIEGYESILQEDENYYTTEWFDVDSEGEYLTMSGGFNCAIWQFRDEEGVVIAMAESNNSYRTNNTYSVDVYQMARVIIPDDAAQCRVTYFNKNDEIITASPQEELTIVYGRLPGESREAVFSKYDIPDLSEGEKIIYDENGWRMITPDGEKSLSDWELPNIERGSYFAVSGTLPGRVSFEGCEYVDYSREGIYTIRFDSETSSAVGERLDDAQNLGFNATVGNGKITLGENHFDSIYPWKDIKLCSIKDGVICYNGEPGFMTDGSTGDVFVEIPKFYVKRTVDERYDTISISGVKHEGFEVDSAFLTQDGEKDKIYIAAYHTGSNESGELVSASGVVPVMNLSPAELKEKTKDKGKGYAEVDYAAINAVQKLFMVETGLRNSQYLYMGLCAYTTASENKDECVLALETRENTNCIDIQGKNNFIEGNNVVLFDADKFESSYSTAVNDIREIKVVIENDDGTSSVYFTGDPVDITADRTAIAHVATQNGKTKNVEGHTGAISTERGTVSFKYRNIENLWGNAYVFVDNVTIKNGIATLTDRLGNVFSLAYDLPVEESSDPIDLMVKRVGYDVAHPQVLLPSEVGHGAATSTYYGDTYLHGKDDKEYVLHYGGGWNTRACAGLFSYASLAAKDETYINTTGRMMFINEQ